MTSEDQDAIIGRAVRELRDVKEKLAQLRTQANSFGDAYATVSYHLRNKPEFLRFERENTDTRFVETRADWSASRGVEPRIPAQGELEVTKVIAIRDQIRACLLEKERLEQSLKEMGYFG